MTIRLSYKKAKQYNSIIDYKEYMKKYDMHGNTYALVKGVPKIINVEGTYLELVDLPYIVSDEHQRLAAEEYVYDMKKSIRLAWERDKNERVQ